VAQSTGAPEDDVLVSTLLPPFPLLPPFLGGCVVLACVELVDGGNVGSEPPAEASVSVSVFPFVEDKQQFPCSSITMVPMGRSAVTKVSMRDFKKVRSFSVTCRG
jgi:hypothetical protein